VQKKETENNPIDVWSMKNIPEAPETELAKEKSAFSVYKINEKSAFFNKSQKSFSGLKLFTYNSNEK
jgi:predicted ribosome-associated RNA-binding protein Tma20